MAATTSLGGCSAQVTGTVHADTIREAMRPLGDLGELAQVFSMLADPGRLRLLVALLTGTELCVCDLAEVAGMSESATSHALRLLRASRIVRVRRAGRMAYYRLEDDHVRQLLQLALTHHQHTAAPDRSAAPPAPLTPRASLTSPTPIAALGR